MGGSEKWIENVIFSIRTEIPTLRLVLIFGLSRTMALFSPLIIWFLQGTSRKSSAMYDTTSRDASKAWKGVVPRIHRMLCIDSGFSRKADLLIQP